MAGDIPSYTIAVEDLFDLFVPAAAMIVERYRAKEGVEGYIAVKAASCILQSTDAVELDGIMAEALRCAQSSRAEKKAEIGVGLARGSISLPFSGKRRKPVRVGIVAAASACGIISARMTEFDVPEGVDTDVVDKEVQHVLKYLRRTPWESDHPQYLEVGRLLVTGLSKMELNEEDDSPLRDILIN